MRCVDCHYLCAINMEILPEKQREELRSRNLDSFTWLACSKSMAHFKYKLPQTFDQVLKERKCRGYRGYDHKATLEQMWQREIHRMPVWYKVAIAITLLIGISAAAGAVWQALSWLTASCMSN